MNGGRTFQVSMQMADAALNEFEQFRQSLKTRMVKEALTRTSRNVILPVFRSMMGRSSGPALRKNGQPRKHLADSLKIKTRRFKDKGGYYSVVGPGDSQPHAWFYEHGTVLRFRDRIGGKYAYLEPLKPITHKFHDFWGGTRDITRARRTTGWMPAANIVPKVKAQTQGTVLLYFTRVLDEKVMKKAERMAGASE